MDNDRFSKLPCISIFFILKGREVNSFNRSGQSMTSGQTNWQRKNKRLVYHCIVFPPQPERSLFICCAGDHQ